MGLFSCSTENAQQIRGYLEAGPSRQSRKASGESVPEYEPKSPKRQHQPVTGPLVKSILQRYEQGESTKHLANELGLSRTTISNVLKRNGVEVRVFARPAADTVAEMTRLYKEGLSLEKVGQRVGFSTRTVHTYLRRAGVAMRSVSGV